MNKKYFNKTILSLLFLAILCIFVANSIISSAKKQKDAEIAYQKLLIEEQVKKEARDAEEKIYIMGKFDPTTRQDFMLIPKEYINNENIMYLRKETFYAFLFMKKTAEEEGINLKITSATRNFIYQKNIWENKWTGVTLVDGKNLNKSITDGLKRFQKILEYSSAPGTSRHHWGTDIDLNSATTEYFKTKEGIRLYEWLVKNAPLFGFCQPYNLKGNTRPTGYNEEKWHWSYLPLAKTFTKEYKNLITENDISGFLGDEYAPKLDLINNYVFGINPECI